MKEKKEGTKVKQFNVQHSQVTGIETGNISKGYLHTTEQKQEEKKKTLIPLNAMK